MSFSKSDTDPDTQQLLIDLQAGLSEAAVRLGQLRFAVNESQSEVDSMISKFHEVLQTLGEAGYSPQAIEAVLDERIAEAERSARHKQEHADHLRSFLASRKAKEPKEQPK